MTSSTLLKLQHRMISPLRLHSLASRCTMLSLPVTGFMHRDNMLLSICTPSHHLLKVLPCLGPARCHCQWNISQWRPIQRSTFGSSPRICSPRFRSPRIRSPTFHQLRVCSPSLHSRNMHNPTPILRHSSSNCLSGSPTFRQLRVRSPSLHSRNMHNPTPSLRHSSSKCLSSNRHSRERHTSPRLRHTRPRRRHTSPRLRPSSTRQ